MPQSVWQVDVEVVVSRREARSAAGEPVGPPAVTGPTRFRLER